ncbi:hypothetical protein BGZ95_007408 [Linnemannia exigua]|uniref:Uncharacterized protein n=1 Tax=Linnemannia exigua TaxID=604196 RepID=A0AAD4DFB9_9FUNG|nr:hypothetical protein BGZ95_007408 [Linnemannia exigua]
MPSTSHRSNQLRVKVNEVAPSLLLPSAELGSRTPMHLVHISNRKLNREVFSNRDRSIHRRIVIKNFLTVLYQLHPIEWIEPSPAVDDQGQWLEQTLSAAGIDSQDDDDTDIDHSNYTDDYYTTTDSINSNNNNNSSSNPGLAELSPSAAAAASVVTSRRRPLSLRSNKVPLPRPASIELSQSLHSYLSTVFDVNWSVGQSNTEDSFVTASPIHTLSTPSTPSSLSSSSSSSGSSTSSRSQALSSRRPSSPPSSSSSPSGRRTTIESRMDPEPTTGQDSSTIAHRHRQQDYLQEASSSSSLYQGQGSSNSSSYSNGSTDIYCKVDESHHLQKQQQQRQRDSRPNTAPLSHRHPGNKVATSPRAGPESNRTPPPRPSTPPPPLSSKALTTKPSEKNTPPPRPERPSSPSAMPYTLSFDPDPSLSMPFQPNYNYAVSATTAAAAAYEPVSIMAPQQHIHNHIHIHVHNYPPESNTSTTTSTPTPPRRPTTPTRSSRYPKPPPPRPTQTTTTTTTEYISYSTDYSQSIHSQWVADPNAILAATATATASLPPTWQPVSLESLLPTSTTTTTAAASYPPEKSAHGLLNGSRDVDVEEQEEEQPYLATSPPAPSRYLRSPPPPPYTQSADQTPFAAPLSPSLAPAVFSPFEQQQQASPKQQHQPIVYSFAPVLTSQPHSVMTNSGNANASANQKLLEYQHYQERQKMFSRDESDKDDVSKSALDGLGFIRRLSRQSSKKKNTLASISAPLPSTLSYSSSSASATTSLSVAVPLHTIGGGLERYHDDQPQQQPSSFPSTLGSPRYSSQPAAKSKNAAVSMIKGTLSSVKSGLSRSSSPTLSPAVTSSIGPIGPPMTMSSSALAYGVPHQLAYHYSTSSPSSTSSSSSAAMLTTTVL